jgi:selenocysteine lyase/cysteine desulfurase
MSRGENAAAARRHARRAIARIMAAAPSGGVRLDAGAAEAANLAATHLADSKGDDLALEWAIAYATLYRSLRSSRHRLALRRVRAAKSVL